MKLYRLWKRREYGYDSLAKKRVHRDNNPNDKQEEQFFRQTNVPYHLIPFYKTRESAENAKKQLEQYNFFNGDLEIIEFDLVESQEHA